MGAVLVRVEAEGVRAALIRVEAEGVGAALVRVEAEVVGAALVRVEVVGAALVRVGKLVRRRGRLRLGASLSVAARTRRLLVLARILRVIWNRQACQAPNHLITTTARTCSTFLPSFPRV